MKREDDQELWDLLGKSSEPTLSPFFARNVVRHVRQERGWRETAWSWLRPQVLIPSAAVAIALLAAVSTFEKPTADPALATDTASADELPVTVAQLDPRDFEVVADLDDLLAFEEEESLWEDT